MTSNRKERGGAVDTELIRELANVLNETGLTEIELGSGENRIRIARSAGPLPAAVPTAPAVHEPPRVPEPEARPEPPAEEAPSMDASHPGAVTSPMVGIVYLAPEPDAEPFVAVGDDVRDGQTLFIVEAMKTMNPIRASRSGRVARVLVENGAPVEYGEVLLILE